MDDKDNGNGNDRENRFKDMRLGFGFFDYFFGGGGGNDDKGSSSESKKKTSCFAAIRVDDEDVVRSVIVMQELIKGQTPDSAKFMTAPAKLHVTLLSRIEIDLDDPADIVKAKTALETAVQNHRKELTTKECETEISLEGVTTFHDSESEGKVIISEIEGEVVNSQLKSLYTSLDKEFKAINMLSEAAMTETPFPYIAHMTIAIVPHDDTFKFADTDWKEYEDTIFGTQELSTVDILTRNTDSTKEEYRCIAQIPLYKKGESEE